MGKRRAVIQFTSQWHYTNRVIERFSVYQWADEKEGASEEDLVMLNKVTELINWLREAEEESDEEEEEGDS